MDKEAPSSKNDQYKKPKRKGRGATTGLKAKGQNNGPKHIKFDKFGRPFGAGRLAFSRDIGDIAQNNIKITYEDWFKVPEGIKDSIWQDIKTKWNFEDDAMRQKVLSIVGVRFRLFKTTLTSFFVYKNRKQRREEPLDDPLPLYKGITLDDWKEFVKQHPAVIEETVRQRLEDRGYLWIKGHTPSSKDVSSHTEELISEINYWDEMKKRGEFVPSEREDVLVKATGKFDRPGFTRELEALLEAVKKEAMVDVQSLVKQHVSEILKDHLQSKSSNDIEITKTKDVSSSQVQNSCHSTKLDDHFLELEGPVPCRLAVFVAESKIVVAEGTVWPWVEGKMVHNTPLTCQNLHVSIDHIIDGNALLPIPWDEHERVGEVIGSFAQWPKSLVLLGTNEDDPMARDEGQHVTPKETAKPTSEKMHTSARKKVQEVVDQERLEDMICYAYSGGYSLFTIEISNLVYCYESPIKLIIMFDDIREIFRYEWLNISILQLWGSFLYEYGTQCGVTKELVGFFCPDRLCTYMHSSVEMERYLTAALKKQQDKRYVIGAFYES
ncbi:hypothetical protein KSS87_011108 [Heliosperma pusillum]|nr:hypothetical protein KSS87_011108 [Heliosperma pusillum]